MGPASSSPLHPEERPCPRDPDRGKTNTQSAWRAARAGLICESEFEPTTSSSSMSLADNDHILTVLGSRTGFSAEIRVVANVEGDCGATQICRICKKPKKQNCDYISPGLGVFFPKDSLIWLDDPTS